MYPWAVFCGSNLTCLLLVAEEIFGLDCSCPACWEMLNLFYMLDCMPSPGMQQRPTSGELETQKLSSQLLWLVTDTGRTELLPGFTHWELCRFCNQNEIIEPCSPSVKRVLEKNHWKSTSLPYILESFEQASSPYDSEQLEETPSFLERILKNLSINVVNGYDWKLPSLHYNIR